MRMRINRIGDIQTVFQEGFDYGEFGKSKGKPVRISHIELNENLQYMADLSAIGGPVLGPFETREAAIDAELVFVNAEMMNETDPDPFRDEEEEFVHLMMMQDSDPCPDHP